MIAKFEALVLTFCTHFQKGGGVWACMAVVVPCGTWSGVMTGLKGFPFTVFLFLLNAEWMLGGHIKLERIY